MISLDQLNEAKSIARKDDKNVGDVLVALGYTTSEETTQALAEFHHFEYVDIPSIRIPDQIIELVPESVARENTIIPVSDEDDTIKVLVHDPFDIETIEKLRFILNRKVETALAPKEHIQEAINRYYGQAGEESADSMLQEFTDTQIDFTETEEEVERDSPPRRLLGAILSRIKILAKMDIAERRRPQDGRIKITVGEKELDLRVSVIPTNHGQSSVMRLLDKDNIKVGVKQLGLGDRDFKNFTGLIKRPNGIFLVTGPTGSGKTTTLYAAPNALNRPDRKIITAEDPVEYYLPGINQVEVRHNIGLDFARIIRAMLRQAPNIILVGEMRDTETAQMGIQASLTGHLVFSTLHTNDAPSAVTRMTDMGVPAYMVASSVIAVLAQRLVRKICTRCKYNVTLSDPVLEEAGLPHSVLPYAKFAKGKGCPYCQKKGYRGRIGIYELMLINGRIREMMFGSKSSAELRTESIKSGMTTLYCDGLRKVITGITTLDEVYRSAKKTEQEYIAIEQVIKEVLAGAATPG